MSSLLLKYFFGYD